MFLFAVLTGVENDMLLRTGDKLGAFLFLSVVLGVLTAFIVFPPSIHSVERNGSFGFVLEPQFSRAATFRGDLAVVQSESDWKLIGRDGTERPTPEFEAVRVSDTGPIPYRTSDGWGFLKREGGVALDPEYQDVGYFSSGLAPVKKEGRWGYVNRQGKMIVTPRYDSARRFSGGRALVTRDGRKGFINRRGDTVIPFEYDDARSFRGERAAVEKNDRWGYVDAEGEWVIQNRYTWASNFREGRARVRRKGRWEIIDRTGTVVRTISSDFLGDFHDGRAMFRDSGKVGYLDRNGDTVIEPRFESGSNFRESLAPVRKDGRWGYVDRRGHWKISPRFELASEYSEGLAAVRSGGEWGYVRHPSDHGESEVLRVQNDTDTVHGTREVNLDESLVKDFPDWRVRRPESYVSIGKGFAVPEWHREISDEIRSYGRDELIYEFTRHPYELPNAHQREVARELYRRSLRSARKHGWFDYKNALEDGFVPNTRTGSHLHNENHIRNGKPLVPSQPEYLVYNRNEEDEITLSGFMYLMTPPSEHGPDLAGSLANWHFHVYEDGRCFKDGLILLPDVNRKDKCSEGEWLQRSPEMLHVWFVDHPDGTFATRMNVPEDVYGNYGNPGLVE